MPPTKTPGDGNTDTSSLDQPRDGTTDLASEVGDTMEAAASLVTEGEVAAARTKAHVDEVVEEAGVDRDLQDGDTLVRGFTFDAAIQAYAASESPEKTQRLATLGAFLLGMGDVKQARTAYDAAHLAPPADLFSAMAAYLLENGKAEAALLALDAAGEQESFTWVHDRVMNELYRKALEGDSTVVRDLGELEFLAGRFPEHAEEVRVSLRTFADQAASMRNSKGARTAVHSFFRLAAAERRITDPELAKAVRKEIDAWGKYPSTSTWSSIEERLDSVLARPEGRIAVVDELLNREIDEDALHVSGYVRALLDAVGRLFQAFDRDMPADVCLRAGLEFTAAHMRKNAVSCYQLATAKLSEEDLAYWKHVIPSFAGEISTG